MQQSCAETFSAVRASLKRSHDAVDDGVTHGRQAWLRWRSVDPFSPPRLSEATMLKEGVSDHCHERVSVKAVPGSALEVIEPEFFFHLLVGLFTNPSRLDGGSQSAQVRLGGQVGEIVFLLS